MTDPRDRLAEIEQSAEAWVTVDMHTDVLALVAALRAVLDPKVARRVAGCEIYEESCDCGDPHSPCRHSKYLYCDQHGDSADQCTAFINAQVALNSAITKALGGGA